MGSPFAACLQHGTGAHTAAQGLGDQQVPISWVIGLSLYIVSTFP